jgi:hypothetical protein
MAELSFLLSLAISAEVSPSLMLTFESFWAMNWYTYAITEVSSSFLFYRVAMSLTGLPHHAD